MLAVQVRLTECVTAATPVPVSAITLGEVVALLVTVTLAPVTVPPADGANLTFSVAVFPGVTIWPDETPLAVKPAPVMVTFDIVTFEFPALVKITDKVALLPTLTLGKFRLVWLALRISVAAFTAKVAALLVAVPVALVTFTVNSAPLSAFAVAGVV